MHLFQSDIWVFVVISIEGQALDIGKSPHG